MGNKTKGKLAAANWYGHIPAWLYIIGGLIVVPSLLTMLSIVANSPAITLLCVVTSWVLLIALLWRFKNVRVILIALLVIGLLVGVLGDVLGLSFTSFLQSQTIK